MLCLGDRRALELEDERLQREEKELAGSMDNLLNSKISEVQSLKSNANDIEAAKRALEAEVLFCQNIYCILRLIF